MLWSANHSFSPCHCCYTPKDVHLFSLWNNNNGINTMITRIFHNFHIFHVERSPKPAIFQKFHFSCHGYHHAFTLLNRPLIFFSSLCTIIGMVVSLLHLYKKTSQEDSNHQTSTKSTQSPNFDSLCHLEIINNVSLYFLATFSCLVTMATCK